MIDLENIPSNAGVYKFKDEKGKLLYVGKAINLKNRVSSYFKAGESLTSKTQALVSRISDAEFILVDTEVEALLLEAELIKKYRPPYNISLKDDKFYRFIKIIKDKNGIYSVTTTRKQKENNDNNNEIYFGPFPEGSSINLILKTLRKIFPYRDCSQTKFSRYQKIHRPCLYGKIGICSAPCLGDAHISINNENIKKLMDYLKGDRKQIFNRIKKEMEEAAKNLEFEKAAYLRDQIHSYEYISAQKHDIEGILENPNLVADISLDALRYLVIELEEKRILKQKQGRDLSDFRIEVYDISNFQGNFAVGAMVVLTGGAIDKKEYKKFKIKTLNTPNDFAMMQEMVSRRFKNYWKKPDLIIIDGGKGQLSSVLEVLKEKSINIPTVGLAKKLEQIIHFDKTKKEFVIIELGKKHKGLQILMKGRDEAHRFGISYYRKLHRESITKLTHK